MGEGGGQVDLDMYEVVVGGVAASHRGEDDEREPQENLPWNRETRRKRGDACDECS